MNHHLLLNTINLWFSIAKLRKCNSKTICLNGWDRFNSRLCQLPVFNWATWAAVVPDFRGARCRKSHHWPVHYLPFDCNSQEKVRQMWSYTFSGQRLTYAHPLTWAHANIPVTCVETIHWALQSHAQHCDSLRFFSASPPRPYKAVISICTCRCIYVYV